MIIKKAFPLGILAGCLFAAFNSYAQAFSYPGQTLQIYTHFQSIIDKPKPAWTLIIRDASSERVLTYLFDLRQNDNFWVAFTTGHSYIITASTVKWGPYAVIDNFCHLESRVIAGQSMFITLKGNLSPDPNSFQCHVQRYSNTPFPIVEK